MSLFNFFFYLWHSMMAVPEVFNQDYEQWEGAESSGAMMEWMTSNDLMPVVLGVSLIIWLILLGFLIKIDRKVSRLEEQQKKEAEYTEK